MSASTILVEKQERRRVHRRGEANAPKNAFRPTEVDLKTVIAASGMKWIAALQGQVSSSLVRKINVVSAQQATACGGTDAVIHSKGTTGRSYVEAMAVPVMTQFMGESAAAFEGTLLHEWGHFFGLGDT